MPSNRRKFIGLSGLAATGAALAPRLTFSGDVYGENILGFENVANMEQLPTEGALIVALPMKIKGGSGGPLRIVAFVPD